MSGNYALPYILTHPEMMAGFVVISPAASGIVPPSKVKALQVHMLLKELKKKFELMNYFVLKQVPTILIHGDRDQSLGPTSHRDLKTIPNFQAFILPKAGHAAYLDQPDQFHTLLYNFAKKIDSFPW
jgi:pimeloyl-ACP methyl ester carboxylesterase